MEILEKIGLIKNPFKHEVTALYCRSVLSVLEEKNKSLPGRVLEEIVEDYLNCLVSPEQLKQHIENQFSWVSISLYMAFLRIGMIYSKDINFLSDVGKRAVEFNKLQVGAAKLLTLKGIYYFSTLSAKNFRVPLKIQFLVS